MGTFSILRDGRVGGEGIVLGFSTHSLTHSLTLISLAKHHDNE